MMKIVVMGDALVSSQTLKDAAASLYPEATIDVFEWFSDLEKDAFQAHIKDIEVNGPENQIIPSGIANALSQADLFLLHYGPVSTAMIQQMKQGAMIGVCRGGLENVALEACRANNIKVIHVIRNAIPVAEFTVGLMLAETRNIARAHLAIHQSSWRKVFSNDTYKSTLSGKTIGLIGFGAIGQEVMKRLLGFECHILVSDPYANRLRFPNVNFVELDELLSQSDIVSLHARVTPETQNMIGDQQLNQMKPSATLINTARPGLIHKEALLEALQKKRIAGAALDVVWEEPLTKHDPYLTLDNITLTTHIAGDTVDAIERSPYLLANVIKDYLNTGTSDMLVVS